MYVGGGRRGRRGDGRYQIQQKASEMLTLRSLQDIQVETQQAIGYLGLEISKRYGLSSRWRITQGGSSKHLFRIHYAQHLAR